MVTSAKLAGSVAHGTWSSGRVMSCSREVCMGSVMTPHVIGTETRKPEIVQQHAKDFLDQYYSSIRRVCLTLGNALYEQETAHVSRTLAPSGGGYGAAALIVPAHVREGSDQRTVRLCVCMSPKR
uniref:Uncharacterized protein n=1 Tax=Anopheles dirus TaxID=7168 RepID=A0A182NU22_9DIPT